MNLRFMAATVLAIAAMAATGNFAQAAKNINETSVTTLKMSDPKVENFKGSYDFEMVTNVVGLAEGRGNAQGRWNVTDRFSGLMAVRAYSNKEDQRRGFPKNEKMAVSRSQYFIGGSYSVFGHDRKMDLLLSPALAFGSEADRVNVDTQSGLAFSAIGQGRLGRKGKFLLEGGVFAHNLSGDFIGEIHLGTGFRF